MNCLILSISFLQFLNSSLIPLRMTGIEFLMLGFGRTGVPKGGSQGLTSTGLEA